MEKPIITPEAFETFLNWLAPNPEEAAARYENIRSRLIRMFIGRGSFEPEEMAEETINRVISKIPQISENYVGEPILYFYGVANKIHLESLRKGKKPEFVVIADTRIEEEPRDNKDVEILKRALNALPEDQKNLIVEYYSLKVGSEIDHKQLAEKYGLSMSVLRARVYRIKTFLQKAIESEKEREDNDTGEDRLISQIKNIFPEAERRRYNELNERFIKGTITAPEKEELLKLSDKFEKLNSARLEYLIRLARLRGQTLTQVMEKLGI